MEYQRVCSFVGIRSPHTLPRKANVSPPLDPKGNGVGGPNSDYWTESLELWNYTIGLFVWYRSNGLHNKLEWYLFMLLDCRITD